MIEKPAYTRTIGKTLDANLINIIIQVKCAKIGILPARSAFTKMAAVVVSNVLKVMAGTRVNTIQTRLKQKYALKQNH
jgi:hypothetical protein